MAFPVTSSLAMRWSHLFLRRTTGWPTSSMARVAVNLTRLLRHVVLELPCHWGMLSMDFTQEEFSGTGDEARVSIASG